MSSLAVLLCGIVSGVVLADGDGNEVAGVTVDGAFGRQPDVKIPRSSPQGELAVKVMRTGKGKRVATGDLVVAHYVGYKWNRSERRLVASTYEDGRPAAFPSAGLVPGLAKALKGRKTGSRVATVIPPRDGYGKTGNQRLQIGADDSLVFVLDVVGTFHGKSSAEGQPRQPAAPGLPQVSASGKAPAITVPGGKPPSRLVAEPVIQGGGAPVRSGQLIVVQYTGVNWRTGKEFDSSWRRGQVFPTPIGIKKVVTGWDTGLTGKRVGSRVLLVVPPKWGYGSKGLKQAGIKGTDTLVFAVDILGAF